jgi:aminoglycoside 2''-phosphotransferase
MQKIKDEISETYLKKIKGFFPDISFASAELVTVGWDHDVMILDDKYVFRFPKNGKDKESFKREVLFLDHFATEVQISVPSYIYKAPDFSFGGYSILKGTELSSTPTDVLNKIGIVEKPEGYRWGKKYSEQILIALREKIFSKLASAEIAWIEHQFKTFLSLQPPESLTITHGDFNSKHILINPEDGVVTGIFDFGNIGMSDPAFDFGGFWYFSESFVKQVLSYYKHGTDKDFIKRSLFPVLVNMVGDMVDVEEGRNQSVTFEASREKLARRMKSRLSL